MKTLAAFLGAALCSPAVVLAQSWPSHQVRVVVPYAAGSTPDSIARLIFDRVQKATGKPMVIDNKPGASGMIGTEQVARATPDGYTLVLGPAGPLATNALLYKKMSYDPIKNLAPVALVAETPTILVASNATPASGAAALLKAMANPKSRFTYGSPGAGTLGHLNMAYLASRASSGDVAHAPYGGSPQIVTALIANDIQLAALPPLAVAAFVKAGKIKAIATIGPRRSSALPDVPTLKEQGIDFEPVGWFGVETTAGTPADVIEAIYRQIAAVMKDPEVAAMYRAQGLELVDKGPKEFESYIARDQARWKPVIQRNNITLE